VKRAALEHIALDVSRITLSPLISTKMLFFFPTFRIMDRMNIKRTCLCFALMTLLYSPPLHSENQLQFLPEKLADGGYVVYFRHAKRDNVASVTELWKIDSNNSCKSGGSLNSQGRDESRNIKAKMETLNIPAGEAYSSPTCRTKEMSKIIFGDHFTITSGIAPVWVNKQKKKDVHYGELIELLKKPVPQGINRFLISHGGVLNEKTVQMKITLQQSDAAVFKPLPDSEKGYEFLGIIPKKFWNND